MNDSLRIKRQAICTRRKRKYESDKLQHKKSYQVSAHISFFFEILRHAFTDCTLFFIENINKSVIRRFIYSHDGPTSNIALLYENQNQHVLNVSVVTCIYNKIHMFSILYITSTVVGSADFR
jgi:hypothetical protein